MNSFESGKLQHDERLDDLQRTILSLYQTAIFVKYGTEHRGIGSSFCLLNDPTSLFIRHQPDAVARIDDRGLLIELITVNQPTWTRYRDFMIPFSKFMTLTSFLRSPNSIDVLIAVSTARNAGPCEFYGAFMSSLIPPERLSLETEVKAHRCRLELARPCWEDFRAVKIDTNPSLYPGGFRIPWSRVRGPETELRHVIERWRTHRD